jgi:acyl-coenzyme A thioesterase PaaI-like protein
VPGVTGRAAPHGDDAGDERPAVPGHLGLPEVRRDPALDQLVTALRSVQDRVIGTQAPRETVSAAARLLDQAAAELDPFRITGEDPPSWDDLKRTAGTRALAPVLEGLEWDAERLTARVTFPPFFTGGNGAVHGGALPLLFDEVLGRLANTGRTMSRTANLSVDYRRVTPIGRELAVRATFERQEGRKRYLHAEVLHDGAVTAEAHGLFIELRPGAA